MSKETAEFAFDLHAGLSALQVPEFDQLQIIGMAATLAIHIKGLGDIEYEVLRKVSDHFMSIPSYALKPVLEVLAEVEFVRIFKSGKTIEKITPNIPVFQDVYEGLGEYADNEIDFNEHEKATVAILSSLYAAPRNKESLYSKLGLDRQVFDRCITVGSQSGIVAQHTARGVASADAEVHPALREDLEHGERACGDRRLAGRRIRDTCPEAEARAALRHQREQDVRLLPEHVAVEDPAVGEAALLRELRRIGWNDHQVRTQRRDGLQVGIGIVADLRLL